MWNTTSYLLRASSPDSKEQNAQIYMTISGHLVHIKQCHVHFISASLSCNQAYIYSYALAV